MEGVSRRNRAAGINVQLGGRMALMLRESREQNMTH